MNKQEIKKFVIRSGRIFTLFILSLFIVTYFLSGIYSIDTTEIGILEQFGKITNDNVLPGIHYRIPAPFTRIIKIPVKKIHRLLIDDFSNSLNKNTSSSIFYNLTGLSSYCISGDNNIVNIEFVIQYSILNPKQYYLTVKNNDMLLKNIACNQILKILSIMKITEILTYGKQTINNSIKTNIQERINKLNMGILIVFIDIKNVSPPERIQSYFDDVINARIDKFKLINKAESLKNERLSFAEADANDLIKKAEIYKDGIINRSKGDSLRYKKRIDSISNNKRLSINRLYIENIGNILQNVNKKYIVDKNCIPKIRLKFNNK